VLRERGWIPDGVVVGEPTGLDIATDQKGMLVLELIAAGDACHSAHAGRLAARNPIRSLARDLVALEEADLGPESPRLGRTTLEPTLVRAGEARNQVPASASCFLDGRTVPGLPHAQLVASLRRHIEGELRVVSDRLEPFVCPPDAAILRAARAARPEARTCGSATMSDIVFFRGVPGVKVGPGQTDRSHTPDEFVLASEVEAGVRFYRRLITAFAREVRGDRP
jgi:acetylornithine deacetylase